MLLQTRGEGWIEVRESDHEMHVQSWKERIGETYKDMDMTSLVTMIVKRVID